MKSPNLDSDGWRIPREGSKSEKIYKLAKAGMGPKEIARELDGHPSTIGVLLWKIRQPTNSNKKALADYHKKKGSQ